MKNFLILISIVLVDWTMRILSSTYWPGQIPVWQIGGVGISHFDHAFGADLPNTLFQGGLVIAGSIVLLAVLIALRVKDQGALAGPVLILTGVTSNMGSLMILGHSTDWIYVALPINLNLADILIWSGEGFVMISLCVWLSNVLVELPMRFNNARSSTR